jgi:nicotinate-nucleotide pyrophosphorylase (carboxylating)
MSLPPDFVNEIVRRALDEDIGSGDITTRAAVDPGLRGRAVIVVKADGVIAGLPVAEAVFFCLDPAIEFKHQVSDGARISAGDEVALVKGALSSILTAERTALNFLMRMSGIATLAARFVEAVAGTHAIILDTRKTAPGLRLLDKYAVRIGGGTNHRFGLYDAVLIKENHAAAAGSISAAVKKAREGPPGVSSIEVEARSLEEVQEALEAGADRILLDNMDTAMLAESVRLISGKSSTEASGGVTLDNVRAVAETGVDFISVGQLTHSAAALDFSLEVLPTG